MSEPESDRAKFRPELLHDVTEAFDWYETRAEGVGHEFQRAFFAAVAGAVRQPLLNRAVYGEFRRTRLRRFPHSLYYRVEDAEVIFFLLFHGARDPETLRRALQDGGSTG